MSWVSLLTVMCMWLFPLVARAQDHKEDDDEGQYRNGLVATYRDEQGHEFAQWEKTIVVASGGVTPDRRLLPGKFSVRWNGLLSPPENGEYQFFAHVAGQVRIKLRDEVVLDETTDAPRWIVSKPIPLGFDYIPLEITYRQTTDTARFALFWTGPGFPLEPINPRFLFHEPKKTPPRDFSTGEQLVRGLRCASCHAIAGEPTPLASPALDKLPNNLHRQWLVDWLSDRGQQRTDLKSQISNLKSENVVRRMPHFDFSRDDAEALAEFLGRAGNDPNQKPGIFKMPGFSSLEKGKTAFLTLGCLACHRLGEHGTAGLFVGGDLSRVAEKRPAHFFERWLADPASLNRQHRMPVFELSVDERRDLASFLSSCRDAKEDTSTISKTNDDKKYSRGRELFFQNRCDACHAHAHQPPPDRPAVKPLAITSESDWSASCLGETDTKRMRPGFRLAPADAKAVQLFITTVQKEPQRKSEQPLGQQLLIERNCVACHARDAATGLAPKLTQLVSHFPELANQIPAMTPPSLLSVGDKLHDAALVASIRRTQPVHRPWLKVRMPKFELADAELKMLVDYFVSADRIADDAPVTRPFAATHEAPLQVAGSRLVTVDGFGCTSCHQIGKVKPINAPQNARGPDISQLSQRIRLPWFDRWVRNPARIVPGMEMPSMQLAVRGVLDENLNRQLAAVWQVLNTPGFEPPEPNPVQVLRLSGVPENRERTEIVTDVLKLGERTFIKPLLIGLPNRHSMLFDLEKNQLGRWSIGDVARLRTKGKSWFWEAAGSELWRASDDESEVFLLCDGQRVSPLLVGQFPTELDRWQHIANGLEFQQRLTFANSPAAAAQPQITVQQRFTAKFSSTKSARSGVDRELLFSRIPADAAISVRLLSSEAATSGAVATDRRSWRIGDGLLVELLTPGLQLLADGTVTLKPTMRVDGATRLQLAYTTDLPVDKYLAPPLPAPQVLTYSLKTIPGFVATRLPLPEQQMPTALAWRPDGTLVIASLKGRVWLARDTNGDGLEDTLVPFSDELAAPYGLATGPDFVDVTTKFGVLRLFDDDGDGRADRTETIASGWGHTEDYHDWAIGLPRDKAGNYYVGIPCQQDKRSDAAAKFHGTVLKLSPREPTLENPHRFSLHVLTTGHRFPMGLALNRRGDLFVTDNQGNYNPFNELNHVRPGADFGFVNANDKRNNANNDKTKRPPVTSAAIELPHPWTRSVNGICFLNTPDKLLKQNDKKSSFGPFEGHLVGCEYDTRRLIRMSFQPIGDTFQGAAYPLTSEKPSDGPGLLGPLCCEVSPRGELFVGSLRDSGWGGGNNIGEVVRLRFDPQQLPTGIAEMRATRDGFELDFTGPINPARAEDVTNYALTSYRRVSTPAYGSPDLDRRVDRIAGVKVSANARRATLQLAELRPGFVYELRTKNLSPSGQPFFPAEAFFTLHKVP